MDDDDRVSRTLWVPYRRTVQNNTTPRELYTKCSFSMCSAHFIMHVDKTPVGPTLGRTDAPVRYLFAGLKIPSKYCEIQYASKSAESVQQTCDATHTDKSLATASPASLCSASACFPLGWKSARLLTFCSSKAIKTHLTSVKLD